MQNPMALNGRTIVITGGGAGIGLAIGKLAIELGGNVVAVDLNTEALSSAAAELGDKYLPIAGDITDPNFVASVVEQGASKFGVINGLVNNAGIVRAAMIEKMSLVQWQQVIDVHLNGSFYFTQALGRHWLEKIRAGEKIPAAIVNISSDAGRRGTIGQVNYASAKSALFGLTMSAAREWGKYGIRANAVCFGTVETQMTEKIRTDEKLAETYLQQVPLGRWSTPEEVAVPVCFLLGDGASYITGQVLSVNGGYTITM